MSATTLFYLLIVLVTGVWAVAVIGIWYGRKLLQRQSDLVKSLLPYLKQVQQERETIRSLSISDATPLSNLQDITLPENVRIDFQHQMTQK